MIFSGGYGSDGYSSKILRYDSSSSSWSEIGNMLHKRDLHAVIPFNVTAYFLKHFC